MSKINLYYSYTCSFITFKSIEHPFITQETLYLQVALIQSEINYFNYLETPMKPVIFSLSALFLMTGCDAITSTSYDIECQNQEDGWHFASDSITDAQGTLLEFEGEWHCVNEKLFYSEDEGEENLFGRFAVNSTDSDGNSESFDYSFIQIDYAQNLVIAADGRNDEGNQYVESHWLTFDFLTNDGILTQLSSTIPYTGSNVDTDNNCDSDTNGASNCTSFAIEYNEFSGDIAQLGTKKFDSVDNGSYQFDNASCTSENNQDWACEQYDSFYDDEKTLLDTGTVEETSKDISLTPDTDNLSDPLLVRDELISLTDTLFE